MSKSIALVFFLFIIMGNIAYSQIYTDTARGEVGDEVIINIHIPGAILSNGNNTLSGKILISNPTVFYPDSVSNVSNYFLKKDSVINNYDTLWYFNIEFVNSSGSTNEIVLELNGEAIAGTDSICYLKFTDVILNGSKINDFEAIIITHTSGTPLPYIRFAKLVNYYSNTVEEGFPSIWRYLIDKPSIVEFYLIDVRGKETFLVNLGEQSEGIHEYIFTIEMGFSSGLYLMKLKTNTGESVVPFIISK